MWVSEKGQIRCTTCGKTAPIPENPCECTDGIPDIAKTASQIDATLVAHLTELDSIAERIIDGIASSVGGEQAYFTGCATLLRLRRQQYDAVKAAVEIDQTADLRVSIDALKDQIAGRGSDDRAKQLGAKIGAKRSKRAAGRAKPLH